MRLKWLGHSAFLLTTSKGTRVAFDPFQAGAYDGALAYPPINETADILLMSHTSHPDHGYSKTIKGDPVTVTTAGSQVVKNVTIEGLSTFHDESKGRERGLNIVFTVEAEGIRVTHFGDLGHDLSESDLRALKSPNVVLVPVGGFYTVDAKAATRLVERLRPNVAVPMHYKTEHCKFPIATAADFLKGKEKVTKGTAEVEFSMESLPNKTEVWVLDYPRR